MNCSVSSSDLLLFRLPQAFTGAAPFDNSPPAAAAVAIMRGDRPQRPPHPTLSNKLWALMKRCWDQDPRLRPEVSEVSRVFPSSILDKIRAFYEPGIASHEFQLALGRFYDNAEYQNRVDGLHGADLVEFVNFLDTVQQLFNVFCPSPYSDTLFRCYRPRGYTTVNTDERYTTYGKFAAVGP